MPGFVPFKSGVAMVDEVLEGEMICVPVLIRTFHLPLESATTPAPRMEWSGDGRCGWFLFSEPANPLVQRELTESPSFGRA